MKKTMLVDLDYVICKPGFLKILNDFLGTKYKESDFTEYIIDDIIGSQDRKEAFYEYYLSQDGYRDAVFIDDVKEVLESLAKEYEIYICTACVMFGAEKKSGKLFMDKFNFLVRELDCINPENYIFTNSKNIFKADVQIDDRLPNLQGDVKVKLLFDAYHNKDISAEELSKNNVIRVNSWKEIQNILQN